MRMNIFSTSQLYLSRYSVGFTKTMIDYEIIAATRDFFVRLTDIEVTR